MKLIFIINNKNNRLASILPGLRKQCEQANPGEVRFVFTAYKKHAIALARKAVTIGCDYLIAVGGDGTLNEVVNGVLQSRLPADNYPILGLLPFGSANDFARTAGISKSVEALFARIQTGAAQKIDLGKIVLQKSQETRYFINIAGVGMGPEVVQQMERSSGMFGPGFTYFWHIVKGFLGYVKKEVRCYSSTWEWSGNLLQMAVAKGRFFGRAICIAPEARLADGQFQVAIFGNLSLWDYLKNFGKLKKGEKISHPEVCYYQAREVFLESNAPCGIEADGEYVGLAPATLSVLPKAIRFLISPDVP